MSCMRARLLVHKLPALVLTQHALSPFPFPSPSFEPLPNIGHRYGINTTHTPMTSSMQDPRHNECSHLRACGSSLH